MTQTPASQARSSELRSRVALAQWKPAAIRAGQSELHALYPEIARLHEAEAEAEAQRIEQAGEEAARELATRPTQGPRITRGRIA